MWQRFGLLLLGLGGLCACEQFRTASECKHLADIVNPAIRDIAQQRDLAEPNLTQISDRYEQLAGQVATLRLRSTAVKGLAGDYTALWRETAARVKALGAARSSARTPAPPQRKLPPMVARRWERERASLNEAERQLKAVTAKERAIVKQFGRVCHSR